MLCLLMTSILFAVFNNRRSSQMLLRVSCLLPVLSLRTYHLHRPDLSFRTKPLRRRAMKKEGPSAESIQTEKEDLILGTVSEEFREIIRTYKKAKAPKQLYEEVVRMSQETLLDRNMTVYAFRNLQRMERHDLALDLIPVWQSLLTNIQEATVDDVTLALPLLKSSCRAGRMDLALALAHSFHVDVHPTNITTPIVLEAKKAFLPELAHGYVSTRSFTTCNAILAHMEIAAVTMSADVSKHILKSFLRGESSTQIRRALRAICSVGINNHVDVDLIQILCGTYLKSLSFIKGAVSMDTLPPEKVPEVCFIGRSNVGKSSLINMLTNTKKLAFTSKTPGKTSEFNYFLGEGSFGPDKESHSFYLVDVPGVGYAEVNKYLRQTWLDLLRDYTSKRTTLRLVCHLVDSRHGLLKADEQCLALIDTLPCTVQYVMILTKADKRSGEGRTYIVDEVKAKVREYTARDIPVILSSSETREGGAKIWSTMLDAFCGDHIPPEEAAAVATSTSQIKNVASR